MTSGDSVEDGRRGICVGWPVLAVLALLMMQGCTGVPLPSEAGYTIDTRQLLAGQPILQGAPMPVLPDIDLLAVTPAMREFMDFYVEEAAPPAQRLQHLMSAIGHSHNFRINYSADTLTAAETFHAGSGNCLSFTNLFIAMARELGLKAQYQEVDVPPYWDLEGDTLVLNRHINIFVKTPAGVGSTGYASQVVDFNMSEIREDYPMRRVSDRRAEAHFYSNRGVDYLQAGNYPMALAHLRRAIELDSSFTDTWINLGALYSRLGELEYAEQAYLRSVQQKVSMIGLSSLVSVYERQGRLELAAEYRDRVTRFRNRNPYYRYHVAQRLLRDGHYEDAIAELETAIELKPTDGAFHFLLGVAHLQRGQRDQAMARFDEAKQLAGDAAARRRYGYKIERLLAEPETAAL